jgi:hypothetical protein
MGAGIKERQREQNERGNQPARPKCAAASSAVGSIHGVIAKFVILFSHVSKKWSTYVMPLCPVLKWPMGQVKTCLRSEAAYEAFCKYIVEQNFE